MFRTRIWPHTAAVPSLCVLLMCYSQNMAELVAVMNRKKKILNNTGKYTGVFRSP